MEIGSRARRLLRDLRLVILVFTENSSEHRAPEGAKIICVYNVALQSDSFALSYS
jgi:hypothetical protein